MKTAKVNGELISAQAVEFEFDRLVRFYMCHGMTPDEIRNNVSELQKRALDQAIGAKLLLERSAQLDLPVSAAEIDAEVAKVIEQVGGEENYKKALAAQNVTEKAFRKELEKGARVNKLVNQACSHVAEPTEKEISDFYIVHKHEYVTQPKVLCQHILVKSEENDLPEAKSAAFEKIREIRERVMNGGDFAEEAKKHSDCPSGREGGSLGWFGPGMMVPEFDKAAFSMKKGEVSDIVQTQFGYHIIYKADEQAGGERTLVEAHDEIRDLLRHQARGKATEEFVNELREAAKIEYVDLPDQPHDHECGCGCEHHHH